MKNANWTLCKLTLKDARNSRQLFQVEKNVTRSYVFPTINNCCEFLGYYGINLQSVELRFSALLENDRKDKSVQSFIENCDWN